MLFELSGLGMMLTSSVHAGLNFSAVYTDQCVWQSPMLTSLVKPHMHTASLTSTAPDEGVPLSTPGFLTGPS